MPIYEYQCTACGHELEALQKMSDDPLKDCPQCTQPALNKLVSAAGFQLKGTGWYVTDYSDRGKVKQKDANKAAADGTASSSTSSSTSDPAKSTGESKPASSTETKTTASSSGSSGSSGAASA